ncbi:MAG TPA: DUF1634 domain-containing protein [Thermodesulfobacteriota bacterium]|nr:DUF1634 domain-containing protein [Thermodesulfobacteriota bacterium]
MKEKGGRMSDERIDLIIGNLLRIAVIVSAIFVFAGAVIYLWRHGLEMPDFGVLSGVPKNLRGLKEIIDSAWQIRSVGIIQLGLLLLIFTPVARVAFSVIAFLLERDYMYVVFTLIVLTVLLLSVTGVIV